MTSGNPSYDCMPSKLIWRCTRLDCLDQTDLSNSGEKLVLLHMQYLISDCRICYVMSTHVLSSWLSMLMGPPQNRGPTKLMVMYWLLLLMGAVPTSHLSLVEPETFQVIGQEETNLDVPLAIPASKASITFRDLSGTKHNLYRRGRKLSQALHLFEDRFSLQNLPSGSSLQIYNLEPSDEGTYEVRDSTGHLVVSVVVEIRDSTECSEQMDVYYGHKLEIFLQRRAEVLEFSPSFESYDRQVVWRRRQPSSSVWSVIATSNHEGIYSARTHSGLELQRICVTAIEDPRAHKYAYITIAVMVIVFILLCWCVCKCCCQKSRSSRASDTLNQSPGLYSAPEEENWYRHPVARNSLIDGFSQIPSVPDSQAEGTSVYPLPPNLSPQSDAGPCFQPTRRNGDSLDFLFTSPLTTDRLPDSVYTSEKLNFH